MALPMDPPMPAAPRRLLRSATDYLPSLLGLLDPIGVLVLGLALLGQRHHERGPEVVRKHVVKGLERRSGVTAEPLLDPGERLAGLRRSEVSQHPHAGISTFGDCLLANLTMWS